VCGGTVREERRKRIETHQLPQVLGWRSFHPQPTAGLEAGKRPSSYEAEEEGPGPITERNLYEVVGHK
jgi:hypothetical protein